MGDFKENLKSDSAVTDPLSASLWGGFGYKLFSVQSKLALRLEKNLGEIIRHRRFPLNCPFYQKRYF